MANNQIRINDEELDIIIAALYLQLEAYEGDESRFEDNFKLSLLKNKLVNIEIRRKNNGSSKCL